MNTALITKVYDKYENRDYEGIGCDNLNPRREIARESPEDELITQVKARVAKIHESLSIHPDFKKFISTEVEIPVNNNDSAVPMSITPQEALARLKMGTPENAPIWGDSPNGPTTPLEDEVNMMIAQITAFSSLKTPSTFTIDCNGIAADINPENSPALEEEPVKSDTPENDPSSDDFDAETAMDSAKKQQAKKDEEQEAKEDELILQCALRELAFLKIILIIVKVIKVLKQLCAYILNIAYTVMDIVQLAAGCWLNYSNIAKIANKIITRVMAIVVQLISKIIQKLWNLLHLECITNMTVDLINQIKAALAAISSIKTICNPNALNFGLSEIVKTLQETWQEVIDQAAKGIDRSALDNLGKSMVQSLKSSGEGAVDAIRSEAMGKVAGAVSSAKSAYETAAKLFGKSNPAAADIANASAVLGASLS